MQADAIVDPDELLLGHAKDLAVPRVSWVSKGYERVDRVVAAIELDDDQNPAVTLGRGRAGGLRQKCRHGRTQSHQGRTLE